MHRKDRKKPCPFEGCGRLNASSSTFCIDHYQVAKPCVFDGCKNRVSVQNFYGFCKEHRWLSARSKRPLP